MKHLVYKNRSISLVTTEYLTRVYIMTTSGKSLINR